jgi:hypothetical protein
MKQLMYLFLSFFVTLLSSYILPAQTANEHLGWSYGYPFAFFTIYNDNLVVGSHEPLIMVTSLNPISLCTDVLLIFILIIIIEAVVRKILAAMKKKALQS